MIIWPRTFALSTEDGSIRVVDGVGRIAAHAGDYVRFGDISGAQGARLRELEQELPAGCPGPYLWAGEVTAISLDSPTTLTLQLPDEELHFPRQLTYLGSPTAMTAEAVGELILEGQCLRLKSEYDDRTYRVGWPPGFTPHVHRGVVHVRNEAGRIIAQVGDRLSMGGGYSSRGGEKCPGPSFGANSIKVLPDVEVYFPKQDGPLAIDQEMGSFVGRLVLDRRCLIVDSVRDRDRVVYPVPPVLIWPDSFTLSTEDEVVGIVDATGRTVARVGDDVQFSAAAVSYGQAMERSGLSEISPACTGPIWVVADDFTAMSDSDSP